MDKYTYKCSIQVVCQKHDVMKTESKVTVLKFERKMLFKEVLEEV